MLRNTPVGQYDEEQDFKDKQIKFLQDKAGKLEANQITEDEIKGEQ